MSVVPLYYEGRAYPSLRALCRVVRVDYAAVLRLRRKYRRAHDDPAIAVDWILGRGQIPAGEPIAMSYRRDCALARRRASMLYQRKKRERARERARRNRDVLSSLE